MPALVPDVQAQPLDDGLDTSGAQAWGEDVVISGISGRLPESDSIEEFGRQLYDGVDLVTDDERRWPSG